MTIKATIASLITLANRCDIPMLARRYRDLATAYERLTAATGWQADNLRRSIGVMISEIGQIKRDGFYANPFDHLRAPRNRTTEAGQ